MKQLRTLQRAATAASSRSAASMGVFVRDVGHGLLEISHNSLAFVGLLVVAGALFIAGRPDLRHLAETQVYDWLQSRHEARAVLTGEEVEPDLSEPDAIARATASDPKSLDKTQAAIATWLSRKYRVAPEPISRLVLEAFHVGQQAKLDPTLILAVMAVESSFNPFAQSPVGAQGLMQVMTKVHDEKYVAFGGRHAAFDPVSNLRVGVLVLKECIKRAGSLEEGLRHYVGAANIEDDGGYAHKVLAEQNQLRLLVGLPPVPLPARRTPQQQIAAEPPALEASAPDAPVSPPPEHKVALAS